MNKPMLRLMAVCCTIAASNPAAADSNHPLTGFYYGTATIGQPASLGTIDLAFYLDVTGATFQGYIDLDRTLLFPAVPPQVGGQDVGPRVSGTLNPNAFSLASDTFASETGGKTVRRQVVLSEATVGIGGASLSGHYVETVKDMLPRNQDLVIGGTFILVKPLPLTADSGVDTNGDGCLSLAEIRSGGTDPDTIEFRDLSAALNLYRHPGASLRVGNPPGPNCTNGEQVLQEALRTYQAAQL